MANETQETFEFDGTTVEGNKGETKNEAWRRLARYRIGKITERLNQLSKLSSTANYDYSQDEVDALFGVLRAAVDNVEKQFRVSDVEVTFDPFEGL